MLPAVSIPFDCLMLTIFIDILFSSVKDVEEYERLNAQHIMLRLALGSLYAASSHVRRALAPQQNDEPSVLDVGTGSGTWSFTQSRFVPI